ncbi:MAG TPA: YdeI/OmpD-associated family protein [Panacibacter sp.]|nr:YdeI/OmpD-associated family protein [Panacibacter sp.]HNP46011.1 YdeI/OmpD-associated family protein [Panacibacter sp.]
MIEFTTSILKFGQQGEKTGWTYIVIQADLAQQLMPGNKKSFRVKGKLDDYKIEGIALIPMGGGDFIMALNADMRRALKKKQGAMITARLEVDTKPLKISVDFMTCLNDEPKARDFFKTLAKSHQNYFSKWIESAKTEGTKTKRIALAVNALSKQWDYGTMIREDKKNRNLLTG